jgi:DNA-binding TFAR19-related protein (PDSD5 family)
MGVAILALALAPPAWGQPAAAPKDKPNPILKAAAANRQVLADLREAQDVLKGITDRRTRERLELLLTRAELRANDVQKELAALAAAAKPAPVSDEDFAKILASLKGNAFDKDKLSFVQNLGKSRYYTCTQVRTLLKEFAFDGDRGKAAVALYPQILDPDNFFMVLEVFTFDSGRKAVRQNLGLK